MFFFTLLLGALVQTDEQSLKITKKVGDMLMLGILTGKARAWNTFVKNRI